MDHTNLIFPKQKSHPHPSLPPLDGGRNRIADTAKRSSENYDLWNFRRPRSSSNHAKHSLRCHSHIKKRSSETHLSDDLRPLQKSPPPENRNPKHSFSAVFVSNIHRFYPNTPLILPGRPIIRHPGRLLGGNRHT